MEDKKAYSIRIRSMLTFVGLAAFGWGLWEYDPRIAMISTGFILMLIGLGKL